MKGKIHYGAVLISKKIGHCVFSLISRIIAAGYYFFIPGRVRESARFYQALFPAKGRVYAYWCVWRQYQRFTRIFIDRKWLLDFNRIAVTLEGWDTFSETIQQNKGAILLMSHVGNWDVAAHLLKRQSPDIRLLIYMGIRNREQLEKMQKKGLIEEGIKIIAVGHDQGSPFDLIEANTFLNSGGLVSLAGDIIWHNAQRTVTVDFLGHEVSLPASPHLLALISERPLFVLFPIKTGALQYQIRVCPPIQVTAANRGDRHEAVRRSAQAYADLLAETVKQHPFEWFHFEPFLNSTPKIDD